MAEPGTLNQPGESGQAAPGHPYVVGIGASAGGLDALKSFFSTVPSRPGISFVVVLHLSPDHESHLVTLLQPYTRLRVVQVKETTAILPDRIYVIPPNANLSAIDTHLRLTELEQRRKDRAPIDHFFRTLATAHDGRSVGVILTGAGSDGALGLRQIKEHGGLTIAQDPIEAEYDGMPRSAIDTGTVDLVLPLREIGEQILRFCSIEPSLPVPDGDGEIDGDSGTLLNEILAQLRQATGHELSVYRRAILLRRIRHRMQLKQVTKLEDYRDIVRNQPGEARALASELMLIVTEFFRGRELFEQLESYVIPHLFDVKSRPVDQVRAWSIGCATGEEAYSLTMLMLEASGRRKPAPRVQLFASDMSDDMLQRARSGIYPHEIVESVSEERLARFFEKVNGSFRVRSALRDSVVFAAHDLYKDPPFAHIDLIVCRTLLSELQPDVRQGVLKLFRFVLEPHGVLVVGEDDPVDSPLFLLAHELPGARMFRPSAAPSPRLVPRSLTARMPAQRPSMASAVPVPPSIPGRKSMGMVHAHMIGRYMPASVLVDENDNVIHYSQGASQYLRLPGGELTHDITRLVGRSLRTVLRDLIAAARRDSRAVNSGPLSFDTEHGPVSVIVHADPAGAEAPPGTVLLVFEKYDPGTPGTPGTPADIEQQYRIRQLETELDQAKAKLHGLLAESSVRNYTQPLDHAAAHATDQLVGILNELEDSRRELQSANNELQALDRDNAARVRELAKLNDDLRVLLESTGVASLFLDRELRILRFTPELRAIFNLKDSDRGRPLADLRHGLRYDTLREDAARVIEHLTPIEREIEDDGRRWFLSRMLPYHTAEHTTEGVVITLIDITDRKRVEQELREQDRRKDEFLAMLAHELRNPLAPIITGIEVLKRAKGEPAAAESIVATIGRQARQLVRLVDDLLDVSRVTGGRLRLRTGPVKLEDIVRDAVASVKPLIDRAAHELVVQVAAEPMLLNADSARLTQVLANLLNNAARYTPNGGRIELRAASEDGEAVVRVRDNGIGISTASAAHVFDMFYQADDSRAGRQQGLGLGLTLAKSLVEMHGGRISVESAGVGRGSEFTIRLPIAADLPADAGTPAKSSPEISGRRVLIVDDNTDAAQTMKMLIDTLGANQVQVESSGAAALSAAAAFRPDVVLLDLRMPEMDGYEVARRLRQQPGGQEILLVAVSGWGLEEHKRRARAAGFDRHLTKPADRASLEAVLADTHPRASRPGQDAGRLH